MTIAVLIAASLALAPPSVPQHDPHAQHRAGMDHRGNQAMGFDQARIRHAFTTGQSGGTIQVVAIDAKDTETVARIRTHLREIAKLFKAGDFSKPVFIHAENPPGVDTLKARRAEIDYRYADIPSGGTLTISSSQPDAVAAIHSFLQFQQSEHKR
jgi:hypothetical protein